MNIYRPQTRRESRVRNWTLGIAAFATLIALGSDLPGGAKVLLVLVTVACLLWAVTYQPPVVVVRCTDQPGLWPVGRRVRDGRGHRMVVVAHRPHPDGSGAWDILAVPA